MLKARVLTALILIPLVIAGIFLLPPFSFLTLSMLFILLAGWEWTALAGINNFTGKIVYLAILAAFLLLLIIIPLHIVVMLGIAWWLFALILLILFPKFSHWWGESVLIRSIFGLLVLGPCWIGLIILQGFSPILLLYCLILIWGVDSVAYFVGKKWGSHKFAPQISPGKTYEGFIGGLLAAAFIAGIGFWLLDIEADRWAVFFMLCMLGGGLITVFGDLFESMIKRKSNVKDSGSILPGHGGLLDRVDSITTALPFFALVFVYFFNG